MALSISRINQTTHLTPVILSEAPERFVIYQHHRRGVEGSRGRVIYDTVSGSSHESAIAARCGLGGFFLCDRSWSLPLGAFHSAHGMKNPSGQWDRALGKLPTAAWWWTIPRDPSTARPSLSKKDPLL